MPSMKTIPLPTIDTIHGITVADPYRWLEDRDSELTCQWIKQRQEHHDAYFAGVRELDLLQSRVEALIDVENFDQPVRVRDCLFYIRRRTGQEQASICAADTLAGQERILIDPAKEGKFASVAIHRISDDATLLAYEARSGATDTRSLRIFDVPRDKLFCDRLPDGHIRGFAFAPDNSGFFYCRDTVIATEDHTVRFHLFGRASDDDPILFRAPRTSRSRLLLRSDTVQLGIVYRHEHGESRLTDFYVGTYEPQAPWRTIFANQHSTHEPTLADGRLFVLTDHGAPNHKIVELDDRGREIRVIVPETAAPIQQWSCANGRLYVGYVIGCKSAIRSWTANGMELKVADIPGDGTIRFLPSLCNAPRSLFYSYETFVTPRSLLEIPDTGRSVPAFRSETAPQSRTYRVRDVNYPSKDHTTIHMAIVTRHDLNLSTPRPAILTAYGGFGISMTPRFSAFVTILLNLGVVFALPNIRGGKEFGKEWHEAARTKYRQRAFDDFIAATEWLCTSGLATRERIAAFGASNSGLLIGAVTTQRPGLYRAALCIGPLLDMVRYERFDEASRWKGEYGTVDNRDDFHALLAYSPYHAIKENLDYPATFFVTGDRDSRCNPAHVRKMAARLLDRQAQRKTILVDYTSERGHAPVLPLSVRVAALARRLAFICRELNIQLSTGDAP